MSLLVRLPAFWLGTPRLHASDGHSILFDIVRAFTG